MKKFLMAGIAATAMMVASAAAMAQDSVKIAYIDPLSGAFGDVGEQGLNHFKFFADKVNKAGGVAGGKKLEIVGFDNMTNPKESLIQFEKAMDQGIRYITQGNGSSVASALIDAVEKFNARNPDKPVLFLNYAAVDPAFTNDKCSFWHFRWDADSDMKMSVMTDWLKTQSDIKKVYIIGQDYSFGKAVQAAANRMIKEKRPDIQIVGDELHPLGKVKDFAPYIAKIKASGAQAVITGNWGNDMTLLVKASGDAGFKVPYLTYYGGGLGTPAAIGPIGVGMVKQVTEFLMNVETMKIDPLMDEYEAFAKQDLYYYRVKNEVEMLAKAMNDTKSAEPLKVALALEGMTHKNDLGTITMRKDNHQIIQPMFISTYSDKARRKSEKSPFGFVTDLRVEAEATSSPTTCKMVRPNG
jgi:branched-chain amino acid transport system substrate-binding protein